jgi:hypothetical protein
MVKSRESRLIARTERHKNEHSFGSLKSNLKDSETEDRLLNSSKKGFISRLPCHGLTLEFAISGRMSGSGMKLEAQAEMPSGVRVRRVTANARDSYLAAA